MRIAKIVNKEMFKSNIPDGNHHYLVYYNRKEHRYDALQLTHLYIRDNKRFRQIKRGMIKVEKFKEFEVPSGVKKKIYHLKKINNNPNVLSITKRHISKTQKQRIMSFINKKK